MANNAELTAENKKLREQIESLQSQLQADKVDKSEYDKVAKQLSDLKESNEKIGFPTLKTELESANKKIDLLIQERDTARSQVIEAGNTIRQLQATQRVESNDEEGEPEVLNCSNGELRTLAALALAFSADDMGRPHNEPMMKKHTSEWVSNAVRLAKEIVRQTS
jgi:chromosome segregation ATPase